MLTQDTSHLDYFALLRYSKRIDRAALGQKLRVAILSDAATQQLLPVLAALFARNGVDASFYHAEFDSIELEILDETSGLYAFRPEVVVVLRSQNALRLRYQQHPGDRTELSEAVAAQAASLWDVLKTRTKAVVIQGNYVLPYERQFGNFDQKVPASLLGVTSALNAQLATLARSRQHVLILDVEAMASNVGRRHWVDERLWVVAKAFCALEHLPVLAQGVVDVALANLGRGIKCVVLDLDNTLWGGVIGDDGLEGIVLGIGGEGEPFIRLQSFLLDLKRRGVLLAVCSKNDPEVAIRPFREHPDMVLRETDLAVFVANWNNKADNIRHIREVLNIGFDSMVFLDDNPFERNLVREYLPQIIIPELPEDPADYVRFLAELNLFEATTFTDEDRSRTEQYREEAARRTLEQKHTNVDDYLKALDMRVTAGRFDPLHLPRIAQLIQRSNQFNLTTRRYTISECEALMKDTAGAEPFFLKLRDRFGDSGLISTLVLRQEGQALRIDLWLMSCRVLARGVEDYALNHAVRLARARGCTELLGEYLPTAKNGMVRDLYKRLGFEQVSQRPEGSTVWRLKVSTYQTRETFLRPSQELQEQQVEENAQ